MNASDSNYTNRLAAEKSPYLLQHQHNPVDWRPWGEEAFAEARRDQKPIFLSIGYSTCHWCHVMAHESFENPETAKLMNALFVNIKVDREERPDIDRVYMAYVQAVSGSGGWPMSVFLTPDLKPFYGGTYFPPEDRYGRPGFPTLLRGIARAWQEDRERVVSSASQAITSLRAYQSNGGAPAEPGDQEAEQCFRQLADTFDPDLGGFGGAPKFPHPVALNFLFRFFAARGKDSPEGAHALEMALFTLRKMAEGGMHDHLGGGFHRYSVDRFWHVPHYEKMLYDQALLASSYIDAFQITRDAVWERITRDILDYVRRDLTDSEGAFYSAEDADSLIAADRPEHSEGAFYVWTREEIVALLGPDRAAIFNRVYGVEEAGNSPAGSDPHGELAGKNTLIQRLDLTSAAKLFQQPEEEIARTLAESRAKLLAARASRPRPHLDDKILTAWNGLMISSFSRATQVFGDPTYRECAQRAAAFIQTHLVRDGRLLRSYRQGPANIEAFAEDYAALIQGLLDLYEADFDSAHLRWALELQQQMDVQFWDSETGGYFSANGNDPSVLIRMKEDYDGAEPSPNSVAALNLLRLAHLTGDDAFRERARKTIGAFGERLSHMPRALPQMLVALLESEAAPRQIVISGEPSEAETQALVAEVHRHYLPGRALILLPPGDTWLRGRLPILAGMAPVNGKPAAYVCENFACQLPVVTTQDLRELLAK